MWKLFAVGLSVLQIAQAIPHHPGFFHHRDRDTYRLSAEELEAGVSSENSKLIANSTAATVVFSETVTVCARAQSTSLSDHTICIPITKTHLLSQLPLDHFGKHPDTFENRYWVLEEFYKPGSPIFSQPP